MMMGIWNLHNKSDMWREFRGGYWYTEFLFCGYWIHEREKILCLLIGKDRGALSNNKNFTRRHCQDVSRQRPAFPSFTDINGFVSETLYVRTDQGNNNNDPVIQIFDIFPLHYDGTSFLIIIMSLLN